MGSPVPQIEMTWAVPHGSPEDFAAALPEGLRLEDEALVLAADGLRLGLSVRPQDGEFAEVVEGGATHPPSEAESKAMREAPALIGVYGPGGTASAAASMLRVGALLCEAGASGVLVHNSGTSHGAADWLALAGDPEEGAHWAFVATTRGGALPEAGLDGPVMFTSGMHCLGHRDVALPATGDDEADWFALNNFCGYLERSGRIPVDGDVLTALASPPDDDLDASTKPGLIPMQRVRCADCGHIPAGSPMHNPYGLYVLEWLDPDDPASLEYRPSR